jgi:replicative DNA helicase
LEQDHGVGKTTFALQLAEKIAIKNKSVVYVSLEMSDEQIIQKILSKRTKINSRKIRNGDLDDEEMTKVSLACSEITEIPINILTKTNTIQQIEIEARRMKNRKKLDLLVIDYLQLVRNIGNFKSREQEVADISRTLKLLSLELEIPIIALCQLNRNASKNEPTLADIRESGAIEQDADNVIFLYPQEEDNNNIITVDLQKQRAGNTGSFKLKFNKINSEFINIER